MDKLATVVQQRIHAHKAVSELMIILEYFVSGDERYFVMKEEVDKFIKWLWKDSPIS